jgi:NADPH:quinone reductase-like Zn-dependent oxidoreductase
MRALTISGHGALDRLEVRDDIPVPQPPAGWVRVKVAAAALNHLDLFVVGGMPRFVLRPPWILGSDATGTIDAIGPEAPPQYTLQEGDRVIVNGGVNAFEDEYVRRGDDPLSPGFGVLGEHLPGTFAEYVCVPAKNVRVIPSAIPTDVAAGYTLSTLTAWRMCVTRARVHEGDEVLIWGIGGGVALAALAICKARGARVWVTSSSADKLERARALGADETLNHTAVEVGREIRARTNKRGVTVVLDSVGRATWQQSLMALGRGGRLVTCGGTSGPMVETDVRRLFWNQWSLMGSTMGSEAEFEAVAAELAAGRLTTVVDSVHPLDRAHDAFERLQRGTQFGKVVLGIEAGP